MRVQCLYNGLELPCLPVWDKNTYPYATIICSGLNLYHLILSPVPLVADTNSDRTTSNGESITYQCFYASANFGSGFAPASKEWVYESEKTEVFFHLNAPSWSNHDILNTDGTVYLAASEPIPLDYNTIIRWDGNTEGMVTIDIGSGTALVKVSDSVITADQLRNCVVAIKAIDTSVAKDAAFDVANPPDGLNIEVGEFVDGGLVALQIPYITLVVGITNPDAVSAEYGFDISEAGTYILASFNDINRVSILAYNAAVTTPTLDRKSYLIGYLTGQALRRNRGKRVATYETLFDGTVTAEESTNSGTGNPVYKDIIYVQYFAGDKLRITVDGVTSICTAYAKGDESIPCFGNPALLDPTSAGTGGDIYAQRYVAIANHAGWAYFRSAGEHTLKIEREVG